MPYESEMVLNDNLLRSSSQESQSLGNRLIIIIIID